MVRGDLTGDRMSEPGIFSANDVDISIIICTRDRADSLARTLDSLAKMTVPTSLTWEVVIVDNGSSDHTADVVRDCTARLPIGRVVEERPGLSNARNAGVENAKGAYLIWTDDDVIVDAEWLAAYAAAFKNWPDAAVFGGKATPILEPPTPKWCVQSMPLLADMLAVRDFGDQPMALACERGVIPFGLNYAIRTREQMLFKYDPNLGVAPGRIKGSEETSLITAIMATGAAGFWLPDAKVSHIIPSSRQTERYIARYYRGRGETVASYRSKLGYKLPLDLVQRGTKLVSSYLLYKINRSHPAPHLKELAFQSGYLGSVSMQLFRRLYRLLTRTGGHIFGKRLLADLPSDSTPGSVHSSALLRREA
jgi:glycosyltransferase involved in cell wall biosynthesis